MAASAISEVDGLMEGGDDVSVAEPSGKVADDETVDIVEVMTGGE